jgi:hypothetical protein
MVALLAVASCAFSAAALASRGGRALDPRKRDQRVLIDRANALARCLTAHGAGAGKYAPVTWYLYGPTVNVEAWAHRPSYPLGSGYTQSMFDIHSTHAQAVQDQRTAESDNNWAIGQITVIVDSPIEPPSWLIPVRQRNIALACARIAAG